MAIQISVTGLTAQQQIDIGNAYDAMYPGRDAAGLTKAQWVERIHIRHLKATVKDWKRRASEAALQIEESQIEVDYPEA